MSISDKLCGISSIKNLLHGTVRYLRYSLKKRCHLIKFGEQIFEYISLVVDV